MNVFSGLNPQQQQAVMAGVGPILVMAGPGSGKTRVLTHRIAYLINQMGVRPYQILAVTFTNKAAREMQSRVAQLIGQNTRGMALGTFHHICAQWLRIEAESLPFKSNYVIIDQDDQIRVVQQALQDLNLDEKRYRPSSVHSAISQAKNELILPEKYPVHNYRDQAVQRVYQRYQDLLLTNNVLDFDDLLLWMVFLFDNHPAIREKYARRFEHILVDEFQDTNLAQYRLVQHLASFHNNIFVVGDTDQSIYRWRGADYRNVLRFLEDFPDAQTILLEQNYRSTQRILDTAMAVINRHPHRQVKQLFTDRGTGERPYLHEAEDDRMEAAFVVDTIARLVSQGKVRPGDCAVMYRTNAQSRLLEEAFLHAGLPYRLVGAQRFYGRREVKDIIAYLRLIHNPQDELSLARVINVPPRKIGEKTFLALRTLAQKFHLTSGELLIELGRDPQLTRLGAEIVLPERALAPLASFGALLSGWAALRDSQPPLSLMDRVLEGIDYYPYINDGTPEGEDRWENVMELRRLAAEFQEPGLAAFLERVALVSDQDTLQENASAATLLTLHAAKGLEFPVVFIVGLNDGLVPHSRSFGDDEAMLEERRLFYVGITRAQDLLYLTFSRTRMNYGYGEAALPSRFLDDIPYALLQETTPRTSLGKAGVGRSAPQSRSWESSTRQPVPSASSYSVTPKFRPGMHVQHPTWGEGLVLNSRLQDNDEIVDIHFESVGLKRLLASFAGLHIVSSK